MSPQVSIGLAVYNSSQTLAACIRSLLAQTYHNWELLIHDDGSTDGTAEVVSRFSDSRIRWTANRRNCGLAVRLNEAVEMSRGQYFARMDADDVAYPQRIAEQVEYLEEHSDVDLVGSGLLVFRGDGEAVGSMRFSERHEEICKRPWASFNSLPHPTWLGSRAWFRRFPYRSQFRKAQDRDVLLRSYRSSRFACVPRILLGYRQETLALKKILTTRRYVCRALWEQSIRNADARMALGVAEECLKGCVDLFAVASGLRYRLLKHRAVSPTKEDLLRWSDVWTQCNPIDDRCEAA